MTRYEKCSLAIEGIGFALVIISLLATRAQLNQTGEQIEVSLRERKSSHIFELHHMFVDHPEVRPYFYDGRELTADTPEPLRSLVETAAEMHLDVFSQITTDIEEFPEHHESSQTTVRWIRDMFDSSPVLRTYLEKRATWYREFKKRLDARP
jgi:hypothetical protein